MALKYKVGDRVRTKSLDWYNENKDKDGIVELSTHVFVPGMSKYCGMIVTIDDVFEDTDGNVAYYMKEIDWDWTDEMIEGLVEEESKPEPKFKVGEIVYSTTWQRDVIILDILPDGFYKVGDVHLGWFRTDESGLCKEKITLPTDSQLKKPFKQEISLPEGYQFVDENGNVINTNKIVLEKKKKEYPKTYEGCQKYLGEDVPPMEEPVSKTHRRRQVHLLEVLLICRDAYWKLYGEEMGLGKPWEPDWTIESSKYIILFKETKIEKHVTCKYSRILAFPTEEMRDAFYENFKELINECKELL